MAFFKGALLTCVLLCSVCSQTIPEVEVLGGFPTSGHAGFLTPAAANEAAKALKEDTTRTPAYPHPRHCTIIRSVTYHLFQELQNATIRRTDYSWITTPAPECYDGTTTYELSQTCNGQNANTNGATCAAAFCKEVKTEPSCTWATQTDKTSDYAESIGKFTCKQCNQNTVDTRCTSQWLATNLLTGHTGLKGAYCNDKWCVPSDQLHLHKSRHHFV